MANVIGLIIGLLGSVMGLFGVKAINTFFINVTTG